MYITKQLSSNRTSPRRVPESISLKHLIRSSNKWVAITGLIAANFPLALLFGLITQKQEAATRGWVISVESCTKSDNYKLRFNLVSNSGNRSHLRNFYILSNQYLLNSMFKSQIHYQPTSLNVIDYTLLLWIVYRQCDNKENSNTVCLFLLK